MVRNFSIFTYLLYGSSICEIMINVVNERLAILKGSCGTKSLTEAAMAPISAPMFVVFDKA